MYIGSMSCRRLQIPHSVHYDVTFASFYFFHHQFRVLRRLTETAPIATSLISCPTKTRSVKVYSPTTAIPMMAGMLRESVSWAGDAVSSCVRMSFFYAMMFPPVTVPNSDSQFAA